MCGIAGSLMLGKRSFTADAAGIQRNLLLMSTLRGVDGTGIAVGSVKNPSDVVTVKEAKPATHSFSKTMVNTMAEGSRWMLMHCRAATIGDKVDDACHPFEEGQLVGVHNGTIRDIKRKFPTIEGINDSQILYRALSQTPPEEATTILSKIDPGAYALSWYDKRIEALRFARNSQRTLWFYKDRTVWWWASEPALIAASIGRERMDWSAYKDITPWLLGTNRLLTVPVNGDAATVEEYTPTPVVVYSSRKGGWSMTRTKKSMDSMMSGGLGIKTSHSDPATDRANQQWWAEELQRQQQTSSDAEKWITMTSTGDLWDSPAWFRPYKLPVFRSLRWLFGLCKGKGVGSSKAEFTDNLKLLAASAGAEDESTLIYFRGNLINHKNGMTYGAITTDDEKTMPVVGMMKAKDLEVYLDALKKIDDPSTAVPLIAADIIAVIAYSDGTLGLKLDHLTLEGWEPRSAITLNEQGHGGSESHPHILACKYPSDIDWSCWL